MEVDLGRADNREDNRDMEMILWPRDLEIKEAIKVIIKVPTMIIKLSVPRMYGRVCLEM